MKNRTAYLNNRNLIASAMVCVSLVFIRYLWTTNLYYIFLLWNLFLAFLPLLISEILIRKAVLKFVAFLLMGIWLIFLPNAFYVVTDLIHLRYSTFPLFDGVMISLFAVLCLFIGFRSMMNIKLFSKTSFSYLNKWMPEKGVLFLSAFGIFIGRFLRYNSWDVITNPYSLFKDCLNFLISPIDYYEVWLFTAIFGLVLTGLYYIFQKITGLYDAFTASR